MNWTTDCAVVIPCLNEQAAIGSVVSDVRRLLPSVVVVDDGSSDGTADAAKRAGAEVLRHDETRGKGTALADGWHLAHRRGCSWALAMDGDGQHSPEDIPSFLECAERTAAELVVGNRMAGAHRMPPLRRLVNRWMSGQISRMADQVLPDSQCGFRLMNLDAWAALSVSAAHFEVESAVLLAFASAGRRIEFVPIQVIYKAERSKIHIVRDSCRWFRWRHQAAKSLRRPNPSPPVCVPAR